MDRNALEEKLKEINNVFPKFGLDEDKKSALLSRIVMSPGVYYGVPTLRTPEIPIEIILGLLGAGRKEGDVRIDLALSEEDLQAVYLYAWSLVAEISQSRNFMAVIDGEAGGTSAH
ncbi:MAG: DUF433 domain-containing protein [Leptospirales bacterium]